MMEEKMADFVSLSCPSCGGRLKITNDIERFACAYCGIEHIVKRGEGIISLAPVVEGLQRIQSGVDKTASELAIPRLEKEIADLESQLVLVQQIKETLFRQLRATWLDEINLLRYGLSELMKPEIHPQKKSTWGGLSGAGYSDDQYYARSRRLTSEDYQFLIQVCQNPPKLGRASSQLVVKSLVEKLHLLQKEDQLNDALNDKRRQLMKHREIVGW
jgi:predicted RNA-binding Zn-ribbon protein involved in translation (DUF1610 family)